MFQVQITEVQNEHHQISACMTLTQVPPAAQANRWPNRCTESAHPFNIQYKQSMSGLFNWSYVR